MRVVSKITKLVGAALIIIAFLATAAQTSAQSQTLYQRLGEQAAIQAVIDQFITNVAGDTRINAFFANTDIPRLNRLLVEQVCAGTGGPCTYTGRSMKEAHKGMGVKDADFNALVEDLVAALDKFSVPAAEKNELLGVLGPMKADIVEVPSALPATGGEMASALWILVAGVLLLGSGMVLSRRSAGSNSGTPA
jgi:hemoglobin